MDLLLEECKGRPLVSGHLMFLAFSIAFCNVCMLFSYYLRLIKGYLGALLIIAFYLQENVHWRLELGNYRSYVTLALIFILRVRY